jgi:hypothetical protein
MENTASETPIRTGIVSSVRRKTNRVSGGLPSLFPQGYSMTSSTLLP